MAALILLTTLHAQAQQFFPMLRTDVIWEVDYEDFDGQTTYHYSSWLSINPTNDTTINGYVYRLLGSTLMREDSATKKVYRYHEPSGTDSVFYDWTLQVGDSIRTTLDNLNFMPDTGWQTVTNIDTIEVEGTQRRVWRFSNPVDGSLCDIVWYEGIGAATGPERYYEHDCWHSDTHLQCYRYATAPINNPLWGHFCTPLGAIDAPATSRLQLFPNPATDQVQLECASNIGNIKLYNATGQQVLTRSSAFWHTSRTLDLSGMPAGVYVLIAETPHGIAHRKLSIAN